MTKPKSPIQPTSDQAKASAPILLTAAGEAGAPPDAQAMPIRGQAALKKPRRAGEREKEAADAQGVSSDALTDARLSEEVLEALAAGSESATTASAAGGEAVLLAQAGPAAAAETAAGTAAGSAAGTGVAAAATAATATGAASWVWVLPAALVGAAAASSSGSSSTQAAPASTTSRIRVVDGPIEGAKVYVDLNDNGAVDANEPEVGETKAGEQGFANITLTPEQTGHALLAKGGTDLETSKAFAGVLAAPKGSTVINPLTTLVAALMEGGSKTQAQAQEAVKTALGITGVTDLTRYDTFAEASKTGASATALDIHQKAVQVANIIVSGSAAVAGQGGSASAQIAGASSVVDALANKIAATTGAVVFNDTVLTQVLTSAGASTAGAAEAAKSIASVNSVVASSTNLAEVAQAQVLAQFVLINAIQTGNTSLVTVLQNAETASDLASNVSLSGSDTSAPSAPTLSLGSGVAGGATASEASQDAGVVTVSAESDALTVVTFSRGGQSVVKTLTGTGSAQAVTLSSADLTTLGQGSISVSAVATDAAGNTSSAASTSFTLDTAAPAAPTLSLGTGVANGATLSEATAEGGVLTVTAVAGASTVVMLSRSGGGTVSKTVAGNGSTPVAVLLSAQELSTLGQGSISVSAVANDAAGNSSSAATTSFTLDTQAPGTTVTGAVFSADTGSSGSDLITRTAAQTISGTLSAALATGETVQVSLDNGATWVPATATVGQSAWSLAGQTLSASSTLKVKVTDTAGNDGAVFSQAYVLDMQVPGTTVTGAVFSADTGSSGSDLITRTAAQTLSGTLSAALATGETVQVSLDNGATWAPATATVGQSAWSLAGQTLSASSTLKVKVTDTAGNDGAVYSQAYVLDTSTPAVPTLALATDTGTSSGDGITQNGLVNVTGLEAGASWQYSTNSGASWVNGSGSSVTLTGDGAKSVQVRQTDAAGNTSEASVALDFTLDTALPAISQSGMAVTRAERTVELNFTENLSALDLTEANFSVKTMIGGSMQANTVLSATVSGSKVLLLLASDFQAGMVNVDYKAPVSSQLGVQDAAGNQAEGFSSGKLADGYIRGAEVFIQISEPYTLTKPMVVPKDTPMPDGTVLPSSQTTPAGTVLAAGSFFYTGIKSNAAGDFFLPSSLPKGAMVAVGGVNTDTGVPNNVVLKAPENAYIINPLTTMVQAVMDQPANAGLSAEAASMTVASALGLPAELSMTTYDPIAAGSGGGNDATALAAQKAAAQVATLVTLAGAGGSSVVGNLASQISSAAQARTSVDLNDSTTLGSVLVGVTLNAQQQASMADAMSTIATSASLGDIVSAQSQVLDKVAPGTPTVSVPALSNDATPEVRVNLATSALDGSAAVAGDTVNVMVDGAQVATVTLSAAHIAQGHVLLSLPALSEGVHLVSVRQIDQAGNRSAAGEPTALNIDLSAPTASLAQATVNGRASVQVQSSEAGFAYLVHQSMVSDSLNEAAILAADSALWRKVSLSAANTPIATSVAGLSEGAFQLVAVDAAGNLGAASSTVLTVDITAPLAAVGISSVEDDGLNKIGTGTSNPGTSDNTLAMSGTVIGTLALDEGIELFDGSTRLGQATLNRESGTWTFLTPALGNGEHAFTARAVDAAGNLGTASMAVAVAVAADVPAGTVSISSSTAAVTGDTTPRIQGTASGFAPTDVIALYDGRSFLGTVPAAANWSFDPTIALSEGAHQITAVLQNIGRNQGTPSAAYTVTVDTVAPTVTILTDDSAFNVGDSAGLTLIFSEAPQFSGTGPRLLASNGATVSDWAPKAGTDGRIYTATLLAPTAPVTGEITLSLAPWTDMAGNSGSMALGSLSRIAVDTDAPAAPSLSTNFGDINNIHNINLDEKAAGADIRVTASQSDVVKLTLGSNTLVLNASLPNASYADGQWTYRVSAADYNALNKGALEVSATATDNAGNTSAASATLSISADTIAPLLTPLKVDGVSASNNRTNKAIPMVSFSAETGATVTVDWGDGLGFQPVGTGTGVNGFGVVQGTAGGSTLVTLTAPSAMGTDGQQQTLKVKAVDAAYNETVRTASYVLDTTAVSTQAIGASPDGQKLTLTFSEPVSAALSLADLIVGGGHTLGTGATIEAINAVAGRASSFVITRGTNANLASGDSLSVSKTALVDLAGNLPAENLGFVVPSIDTVAPTLSISASKTTLKQGDTVDLILTFSEAVKGFDRSDIQLVAPNTASSLVGTLGTLSAPRQNADGTVSYSISYKPAPDVNATVSMAVAAGVLSDVVGNPNAVASSLNLTVDTRPPKVLVSSNAAALKAGAQSTLTFTFNEAPAELPSVTPVLNTATGSAAAAGTLSALTATSNPLVYTATYTPPAGLASGRLSVVLGSWTDVAGNPGLVSGAPVIEVDTLAPTVTASVSSPQIRMGSQPAVLTLNFSEAPASLPVPTASMEGVTLTHVPLAAGALPGNSRSYVINVPAGKEGSLSFSLPGWTDALGNAAQAVSLPTVVVDTQAPLATATVSGVSAGQAAVAANSTTASQSVTLSGSVSASLGADKLFVFDGSTRLGEAVVSEGSWTFGTSTPLSNGPHSLTVVAEDAAGNRGTASAPFAFSVNATVPQATASIVTAVDNAGAVMGPLASNALTDDSTPQLKGQVLGSLGQDDKVVLYRDGQRLGVAELIQDRTAWSFTAAGGAGLQSYQAAVENAAGTLGAYSAPFALRTDTTPPTLGISASKASLAMNEVAVLTFTFSEAVTGFTKSDITGVPAEQLGSLSASQALAGGGVSYSIEYRPVPGLEGTSALSVNAASYTDQAGNAGGSAALNVAVDTRAPDMPSFNAIAGDGTINQAEALAGVTVTGAATGASRLSLSIGNLLRNLQVSNGQWSYRLNADDLAELGQRRDVPIAARAFDAFGNPSSQALVNLSVDTVAPTLGINGPLAGDGFVNNAEDEQTLTISGTSQDLPNGRTVSLSVGNLTGLSTVVNNNSWTLSLSSAQLKSLPQGAVAVRATALDAADNPAPEVTASFIYDCVAPSAGNITALNGDAQQRITRNNLPTLSVSATPGSRIVLGTGGQALEASAYSVTPNGGNYTLILNRPLVDGSYGIRVVDVAGNVSEASVSNSDGFRVDTQPPLVQNVSLQSSRSGSPTVALPGDTLTLRFGVNETLLEAPQVSILGQTVQASRANNTSPWVAALQVPTDAVVGPVSFSISATDLAGNTMPAASTQALLTAGQAVSIGQASTRAVINWITDKSAPVLVSGNKIEVAVHFAAAVLVDATGGVPQLLLTLIDDAGAQRQVMASYVAPSGATSLTAQSSLSFAYTLQDADLGSYRIGSLSVPGGSSIKEAIVSSNQVSAGLDVNTNYSADASAVSAGNYLYGAPRTVGTVGNDLLMASANSTTFATVDGGAGERDVLVVPLVLSAAEAGSNPSEFNVVLDAGAAKVYNKAGAVVKALAVPSVFPAGIETLVYKLYVATSATPTEVLGVQPLLINAQVRDYGDLNDHSFYGTGGNDTINLAAAAEATRYVIWGGPGNDTITGHAGKDFITGDRGNDSINAGAGNDRVVWSPGNDTVSGGEGTDNLVLMVPGQELYLEPRLRGPAIGGVTFTLDSSNVQQRVGTLAYRLDVDDSGTLLVSSAKSSSSNTTQATSMENIELRPTDQDARFLMPVIYGTDQGQALSAAGLVPTLVAGLGGDDTLNASNLGRDALLGGGGNDTLNGGLLDDYLYGGAGEDLILGGAGKDFMVGGAGNDALNGGEGTADLAGFYVAGAGSSALTYAYDSDAAGVLIKQGTAALAKITKGPNGAMVVTDPVASGTVDGAAYTNFGVDTVTGAENFSFDFPTNNTGNALNITLEQILSAFPAVPPASAVSAVTRIDWVSEQSSPLQVEGDSLRILVHFTNPVVVNTSAGTPTLKLVIVPDDGAPHEVQAAYQPYTSTASANGTVAAQSSMQFVYTLLPGDQGRYHIDSLALNNATVLEKLPGSNSGELGLPADLSLNAGNTPITAGTYLYGDLLPGGTGTAGNDVLGLLDADPSLVPGATGTYPRSIDGAAGSRDVLFVPVLLPGVSTSEAASTYSLKLLAATDTSPALVQAFASSSSTALVSVPVSYPVGVEGLLFYMAYRNASGQIMEDFDGTDLVLYQNKFTASDPVNDNDRLEQGSYGSDVIDKSADTSTSTRYLIRGGTGADTLTGHAGVDFIMGESGNDSIVAGAGNDRIFFGSGSDTVQGGEGSDALVFSLPGQQLLLTGRISGPAVAGLSYPASSAPSHFNAFRMSASDDGSLTVRDFGNSSNTTTAQSMETLEFKLTQSDKLAKLTLQYGTANGENLTASGQGASVMMGLSGNDVLNASSVGDVLLGGGGNDTLTGGAAADLLYGGSGDDSLVGGAGDDFLVGNEGNDFIDGGDGAQNSVDTIGFMLGGVAGGGNLSAVGSSTGGAAVLIKQGTTELARITQGASGALLISDLVASGSSHVNQGADTVTRVEKFAFDYAANDSGTSLSLSLSELMALFPAVSSTISGTVVDGYVSGATVFFDLDNDYTLDSNEASALTNEDGEFTLPAPTASGRLVVLAGGMDSITDQTLTMAMSALPGSSVITPLTSLLSHSSVSDPAALLNKLATVLGFKAQLEQASIGDLGQFDPLAALASSTPALAQAGAAVFTAQQAIMTGLQAVKAMAPATFGLDKVSPMVNTAIEQVYAQGGGDAGSFNAQASAASIIDKVTSLALRDVLTTSGNGFNLGPMSVDNAITLLAPTFAVPIKAVMDSLFVNLQPVAAKFLQAQADLDAGDIDTLAAQALIQAAATMAVAQSSLLTQLTALSTTAKTNPSLAAQQSATFVSGLNGSIEQAISQIIASGGGTAPGVQDLTPSLTLSWDHGSSYFSTSDDRLLVNGADRDNMGSPLDYALKPLVWASYTATPNVAGQTTTFSNLSLNASASYDLQVTMADGRKWGFGGDTTDTAELLVSKVRQAPNFGSLGFDVNLVNGAVVVTDKAESPALSTATLVTKLLEVAKTGAGSDAMLTSLDLLVDGAISAPALRTAISQQGLRNVVGLRVVATETQDADSQRETSTQDLLFPASPVTLTGFNTLLEGQTGTYTLKVNHQVPSTGLPLVWRLLGNGGSELSGSDFSSTSGANLPSGNVNIASGTLVASFNLSPLMDSLSEGAETALLQAGHMEAGAFVKDAEISLTVQDAGGMGNTGSGSTGGTDTGAVGGSLADQNGALVSESNRHVVLLTFANDLLVASVNPAFFKVWVNGSVQTISSAVVGADLREVSLTLATAIPAGADVYFNYVDPRPTTNDSTGVLQYDDGEDVASIGGTPVINGSLLTFGNDTQPPVPLTVTEDTSTHVWGFAQGNEVRVQFTESLKDEALPSPSAFVVNAEAGAAQMAVAVTEVSRDPGNHSFLVLSLAQSIAGAQTVSVNYTAPSQAGVGLQDINGNKVASFVTGPLMSGDHGESLFSLWATAPGVYRLLDGDVVISTVTVPMGPTSNSPQQVFFPLDDYMPADGVHTLQVLNASGEVGALSVNGHAPASAATLKVGLVAVYFSEVAQALPDAATAFYLLHDGRTGISGASAVIPSAWLISGQVLGAIAKDGSMGNMEVLGGIPVLAYDADPSSRMVVGTAAADELRGGAGSDNLVAAGGDDTIFFGPGLDVIHGGAGTDTLALGLAGSSYKLEARLSGPAITSVLSGASTRSFRLFVDDTTADFSVADFNSPSTTRSQVALNGSDAVESLQIRLAAGAPGSDVFNLPVYKAGVNASTQAGSTQALKVGTGGADTLQALSRDIGGTSYGDMLFGGGGNDSLLGSDGRDTLYGGSGNDSLIGGNGSDYLVGGPGADSLDGGTGTEDIAGFALASTDGSTALRVNVSGGSQSSTVVSILQGSSTLATASRMQTGWLVSDDQAPVSQSTVKFGTDTLSNIETLLFDLPNRSTGYYPTVRLGTGSADTLSGSDTGMSVLLGLEGNDTLNATVNSFDLLSGGTGTDTFVFGPGSAPTAVVAAINGAVSMANGLDKILDFGVGDKINLSNLTYMLGTSPTDGKFTVLKGALDETGSTKVFNANPLGGEALVLFDGNATVGSVSTMALWFSLSGVSNLDFPIAQPGYIIGL